MGRNGWEGDSGREQKKGYGKPTIDVSNFVYGANWRGLKRRKKIKQFTLAGKYVRTFESIKVAAAHFGVHDAALLGALKEGHRTCKGYKWRYA